MLLINGTILDESFKLSKKDVCIKEDRISAIGRNNISGQDSTEEILDLEGKFVIPGLIDIHTHGCAGHDTCDGTEIAIKTIAENMAKNGSTSFLPTTMTLLEEELSSIVENIKNYVNCKDSENKSANVIGINMEGPFLSQGKKGAHVAEWIRKPDVEMFERLYEKSGGMVRLVDIAPEVEGGMDFIDRVKGKAKISIAHTEADYDFATEAIAHGISNATHLFNAMPSYSHRNPGVLGAVFDSDVTAEIICDGIHLHPSTIRTAFKEMPKRVVLISDSMRACGMPDGTYDLGGQAVTVCNCKATLKDGTIAGGASYLFRNMKKAISFGIPFEDAVRAATLTPAKAVGVEDELGSIEVGKYADLLILDKDYNLEKVVLRGKML